MSHALRRREVVLRAAEVRRFDPAEWADAIVQVHAGEIELETTDGGRRTFGRGAVLCFTGVALRVLRNPGTGVTTLIVTDRRGTDSSSGREPSYSHNRRTSP